jgi:hypothetical protein
MNEEKIEGRRRMNEKKKEKGKKNEKQKGADLPSWIVASGPKL